MAGMSNQISSQSPAAGPGRDTPPLTPEQAKAPTSFRCGGCHRVVKTSAGWIGKPETCPYCGTRTIVGQGPAPVAADPRRTATNTLLVGLLAIGLGFVGLFFRKYFGEAASFAAIGLGFAAPILAVQSRNQLTARRVEFPSRTQEAERVKIHSGFGAFFGLLGLAMGVLAMVLGFVSMGG